MLLAFNNISEFGFFRTIVVFFLLQDVILELTGYESTNLSKYAEDYVIKFNKYFIMNLHLFGTRL